MNPLWISTCISLRKLSLKSVLPCTNVSCMPQGWAICPLPFLSIRIYSSSPQICCLKVKLSFQFKEINSHNFTFLQLLSTTATKLDAGKFNMCSPEFIFEMNRQVFVVSLLFVYQRRLSGVQKAGKKSFTFPLKYSLHSWVSGKIDLFFFAFIKLKCSQFLISVIYFNLAPTQRPGCVKDKKLRIAKISQLDLTSILVSYKTWKTGKIWPGVYENNSTNLSHLLKQVSPQL